MDRAYASGASGTPPTPPVSPSMGFPTPGNPAVPIAATRLGAYWAYMITESLRHVIVAAGLTPDHEDLTLLTDAVAVLATPRPGHTYTANDWTWLDKAGGLMVQWGTTGTVDLDSTLAVTFPIAFPNAAFGVFGSGVANLASGAAGQTGFNFPVLSASGFTVANDSAATEVRWWAVGR